MTLCCRRGWYALTLLGYLGTFALLLAWYTVLAPSEHFPVSLVLLVLVGPLLFPLPLPTPRHYDRFLAHPAIRQPRA